MGVTEGVVTVTSGVERLPMSEHGAMLQNKRRESGDGEIDAVDR